jgi:hypothetical protein
MNRYATACQRRQRTQRLRSRAQEKRKHRKREELFKELVSEEAESRQELMARQLKANWNVGRQRLPPPCSGDCLSCAGP